jgi:hypothetical protein
VTGVTREGAALPCDRASAGLVLGSYSVYRSEKGVLGPATRATGILFVLFWASLRSYLMIPLD